MSRMRHKEESSCLSSGYTSKGDEWLCDDCHKPMELYGPPTEIPWAMRQTGDDRKSDELVKLAREGWHAGLVPKNETMRANWVKKGWVKYINGVPYAKCRSKAEKTALMKTLGVSDGWTGEINRKKQLHLEDFPLSERTSGLMLDGEAERRRTHVPGKKTFFF